MPFSDWVVLIYSSLRYVERLCLKACYERQLTPSPYIFETELYLIYFSQFEFSPERYINVLWRSWGLVRETVTVDEMPVIRYRVNVARVTALSAKFLTGAVNECM